MKPLRSFCFRFDAEPPAELEAHLLRLPTTDTFGGVHTHEPHSGRAHWTVTFNSWLAPARLEAIGQGYGARSMSTYPF